MAKSETINILGVRVNNITMTDTLSRLAEMLQDGNPHQIVTVNPEFIMTAQKNNLFREVLNNASLAIPDGIGVVLASWWLGKKISERVAGADLVDHLTALAGRKQLRIFFLGAKPGVAERAAKMLQEIYPGFIIAGTYAGSPHPGEEQEICERIRVATPHILLVAYGAPQQDLWIARNMNKINVPIAIGVGGTFDFITGEAIRAPRWIQKIGMEWFHRLLHEPHRWQRMLALPKFILLIFRHPITT